MKFTIGFKAFDAHELLCHFVAEHAGLYRSAHISTELRDITFIPDTDLPDHVVQASCGAALSSAVKGAPQKIVFVAVDRPMFWIWSRHPLDGLTELVPGRLATFPPLSPPHALVDQVLRQAGIDTDHGIELLPARDDVARLGLLRSGSVDAAVISSAVPPARMNRLGLHQLCFIGDEIRLPSTGLALNQALLDRAPDEVRALAGIHHQALRLIHGDSDLTGSVLRDVFDIDIDIAEATAVSYAAVFTHDGRTSASIAQTAIDSICEALEIVTIPPWRDVYLLD